VKGSCSGGAEAVSVSNGTAEYLDTSKLQWNDGSACDCVEREHLSVIVRWFFEEY
jgi:hypothetical protein